MSMSSTPTFGPARQTSATAPANAVATSMLQKPQPRTRTALTSGSKATEKPAWSSPIVFIRTRSFSEDDNGPCPNHQGAQSCQGFLETPGPNQSVGGLAADSQSLPLRRGQSPALLAGGC